MVARNLQSVVGTTIESSFAKISQKMSPNSQEYELLENILNNIWMLNWSVA